MDTCAQAGVPPSLNPGWALLMLLGTGGLLACRSLLVVFLMWPPGPLSFHLISSVQRNFRFRA